MKRITLSRTYLLFTSALFYLLLTSGALFGQEFPPESPAPSKENQDRPGLSEEEVRSPRVNFINRTLRPAPNYIRKSQRDTGKALAQRVASEGVADEDGITIRRIYSQQSEGFGADLIQIKESANFGHINAVQRVLSGYLGTAFEYNDRDAALLSRYILYYNARNRGKLDEIKAKYSQSVVSALNPQYVGISRSYRNWSGQTQILLPLKKNVVRPGKTDLNFKEVDEGAVQVPPDDKKKMEQLKEERTKEDLTRLDTREEELNKKQQEIQKQKEELQTKIEETQKQREESAKKTEELKKNPEKNADQIAAEENRQESLAKEEQQNEEKLQSATKEEAQVKEEIAEVQKQRAETTGESAPSSSQEVASNASTTSSQPTQESPPSQEEVQQIIAENQALKEQIQNQEEKSPNVVGEKILFLKVLRYLEGGHYNNELWQIDARKDDALKKGPFTNICGKEFTVISGQGVLVIGYENEEHLDDKHHLILLNPETLAMEKSTKEEIFWRSPMIYRDNKIYAYEIHEGQHYLTRFNPDLTLDVRSSDPINPDSDITFYKEKIYITGKSKGQTKSTIRVFSRKDLTLIKTIET